MLPKLIGHRGASAYAPENTLAAVAVARKYNLQWVEVDIRLAAGDEPILMHDVTVNRTTNGKGEVSALTYATLSTLDAGIWFNQAFKGVTVPHLKDLLHYLVEHNMQANLELKPHDGNEKKLAFIVLECINRYWPSDRPLPLISSFSYACMQEVRKLSKAYPIAMVVSVYDKSMNHHLVKDNFFSVHIDHSQITELEVKIIHANKLKVVAYTVNEVSIAKKLYAMGVDSIITDIPDLMQVKG